jgi:hypothetical protein
LNKASCRSSPRLPCATVSSLACLSAGKAPAGGSRSKRIFISTIFTRSTRKVLFGDHGALQPSGHGKNLDGTLFRPLKGHPTCEPHKPLHLISVYQALCDAGRNRRRPQRFLLAFPACHRRAQGQQRAEASGDISPVRWAPGSQREVHNVSPALIAGHACHCKWIFH